MRKLFSMLYIASFTILMGVVPTHAESIIFSTTSDATLGSLTFENGDLIEYNPITDTSTLFFDEDLFSNNEDIDAVHLLANGNIVLSTSFGATLGGLTFEDGDLVEYNPINDTSNLFFDEDLFSSDENIDAVSLLANGNILLSAISDATLGGLTFEDGDLVEYNPISDTSTLFFDEDLFSDDEDIDAVHLLANGNIILSNKFSATLGGLTFEDGDLVEYNPVTDTATLFFDEDLFSDGEDIDALYLTSNDSYVIPEPATILLFGLGALGGFRIFLNSKNCV